MDSALASQAGQLLPMGPLVLSVPQVFSWARLVIVKVRFIIHCSP
jgi:hypothetical protein